MAWTAQVASSGIQATSSPRPEAAISEESFGSSAIGLQPSFEPDGQLLLTAVMASNQTGSTARVMLSSHALLGFTTALALGLALAVAPATAPLLPPRVPIAMPAAVTAAAATTAPPMISGFFERWSSGRARRGVGDSLMFSISPESGSGHPITDVRLLILVTWPRFGHEPLTN